MRASMIGTWFVVMPMLMTQCLLAGDLPRKVAKSSQSETSSKSLLDALKSGEIAVDAVGTGDGRMLMSITNQSRRSLNVVVPPGLIASGATGQFGGGFGGGRGVGGIGQFGGGGGAQFGGGGQGVGGQVGGGLGQGVGGAGGGGIGNNRGVGGGSAGFGGSIGTVPASLGMMNVGRLIMNLAGERESWSYTSLYGTGMQGGANNPGNGGFGNGGFGRGFRSIAPTGQPFTTLQPGQTRKLPTRLVSLNPPTSSATVAFPVEGERLTIGDLSQGNVSERTDRALKRLAEVKAPTVIAQLVLWNVTSEMSWEMIARVSKSWANSSELTLAKSFVAALEDRNAHNVGMLHIEVQASDKNKDISKTLMSELHDKTMLGLMSDGQIPERPIVPGLACKIVIEGAAAEVTVLASDPDAIDWQKVGSFKMKTVDKALKVDELAEGILNELVIVKMNTGKRVKGKISHQLVIENKSPLLLRALSIQGDVGQGSDMPKELVGLSLPPRRSLTVPASEEVVKSLRLGSGVRAFEANLSGL